MNPSTPMKCRNEHHYIFFFQLAIQLSGELPVHVIHQNEHAWSPAPSQEVHIMRIIIENHNDDLVKNPDCRDSVSN